MVNEIQNILIKKAILATDPGRTLEPKAYLEIMEFKLEDFGIDRFWNSISKDEMWYYVDSNLLHWFGYTAKKMADSMKNFKALVEKNFDTPKDYEIHKGNSFSDNKRILDPNYTESKGATCHHLIISSDTLQKVAMLTGTARGKQVRLWFVELRKAHELYVEYVKQLNEHNKTTEENFLMSVVSGATRLYNLVIRTGIISKL
jgi:hypothetical protein